MHETTTLLLVTLRQKRHEVSHDPLSLDATRLKIADGTEQCLHGSDSTDSLDCLGYFSACPCFLLFSLSLPLFSFVFGSVRYSKLTYVSF